MRQVLAVTAWLGNLLEEGVGRRFNIIALYTDILIRLGLSAGRYGYIWDVRGEGKRYDLNMPLGTRSPCLWEIYLAARAAVERMLARAESARRGVRV